MSKEMTTEHVSVPREVYENLAQISEGNMSKHDMQDLASEAYNILSRATPSDERIWSAELQDALNYLHTFVTSSHNPDWQKKRDAWAIVRNAALIPPFTVPTAPRVVTAEDVERAEKAWMKEYHSDEGSWQSAMRAALESYAHSMPHAAVPDGWTERHDKVQRFALRRFADNARDRANVAAQDKDSRHFNVRDVEKFLDDAKTADECLAMLAAAPQAGERG